MNHKQFRGSPASLNRPQRVARLEIQRTVELSLAAITVSNALDIGTGSGLFASAFSQRLPSVIGLDVAPDMLAFAKEAVPQVDFVRGRMEALPFATDAFALIFLGQVLHETDNLADALAELRRCARSRVAALEWPYRDGPWGPPLHHRLRPETVIPVAERVGYARVEVIPLTWMLLYRLTV